jgi:hypothetical protein
MEMNNKTKAYGIIFVSWLLPGMGHLVQKRYLKGMVFLVGIVLLLVFGVIMQGKLYDTQQFHPLMLLGFLGDLGSGLFFFIIKLAGLGTGNIKAVTFHYGTTYLVSAGLINYLVALNAYDIARGIRK